MPRTSEARSALSAFGFGVPTLEPGRKSDPGLFGPDSMVWRIGRERVLLAGGPAALLLQIAHPLVAAGVAAHSDFRRDPLRRLRGTLDATLRISFGDADQVAAAASAVATTHRRVHGRLESSAGRFAAGTVYDATDPELALWVHATLSWMALDAYDLLVRHLRAAERAAYYEEAKAFAGLFGVADDALPSTYAGFRSYLQAMLGGGAIAVGEQARSLARDILRPPLPVPFTPVARAVNAVTAGLLPAGIRAGFGLRWGSAERNTVRAVASLSRVGVRALPPRIRYWPHYHAAVRRMR